MSTKQYLKTITTWDVDAARHVLSRTLFGFTKDDVDTALSYSLDNFIDNILLQDLQEPTPPKTLDTGADWITLPNDSANQTNYNSWFTSLVYWWIDLMLNQGFTFKERMVLFLHNHFVSAYSTVGVPQYMYMQNKLFRQFAFGNFKELTRNVTIDPAMLLYLNGAQNSKNTPNENYARELMELFTLGIGNYTEDDIHAAAKALTGWRIDNNNLTSYFNSKIFDSSTKTFLGQTGNFGYQDVVDIIFSQPAAAVFICGKLYKEFVFYEPNTDYINQLADVFRSNNYELKPTLSTLLKSEYFHSADIRGSKIKAPIHFLLTALKQFQIPNIDSNILNYVRYTSASLSQDLFNPPDVRGWLGQRDWISTTTYPTRNIFTDAIVNGRKLNTTLLKVDAVGYARTYKSSEDAQKFVDDVTSELVQFPLSQTRKDELLQTMLDGAAVYDWSTSDPQAESRLQKFFKALMRLPEYQLS